MAKVPDLGELTEDQVVELLGACLSNLNVVQIITALKHALKSDELEEIVAQLEDEEP